MASLTIDISPDSTEISAATNIVSEEDFQEHLNHFRHLPWLQEIKRSAWDRFNALPMPSRSDDRWRYSTLSGLELEGYHLSRAPSEREQVDLVKHSNWTNEYSGRIIFEDNHELHHDFVSPELEAKGVIWMPLIEAFERHPKLIAEFLQNELTRLGSEKFHYLSLAYAHAGSFLYIPKGLTVKKPFLVYHWNTMECSALFPHTIVVAEENSEATLIDIYASHSEDHKALSIGAANIHTGANARLKRQAIQCYNRKTVAFQLDNTFVQKNADSQSLAINLGAKRARFENQVYVQGEGASAKLHSLSVADSDQEYDQRTHQVHSAPNAVSDLLYKNALLDDARTIFSGLIVVDEEAQKTDAYQTNRNLLLSPTAEANSLPGLEIKANDVKCSHGATTGQIDESELFYMMSRGITKEKARELLAFGFLEEVLGGISSEKIRVKLEEFLVKKFKK